MVMFLHFVFPTEQTRLMNVGITSTFINLENNILTRQILIRKSWP